MNSLIKALKAEIIKNKNSNITWITFAAFALAPVMGGIFMLILRDSNDLAKTSTLSAKMEFMNVAANWDSYLNILSQAVGVGGIIVFGFIAAWIFGREYSENTIKDLLALPISMAKISNAKFIVYIFWTIGLAFFNLLTGLIIGLLLHLPTSNDFLVSAHLSNYFITAILTILISMPTAFFAVWQKGYLAPLGFMALTLVFSQIIAATGYGYYFPWSIPGLYSGAGGEYKLQLDALSYGILILTSMAGYFSTIVYYRFSRKNILPNFKRKRQE
ncbi:MAG: ABC transporter permease [Bacteroidales bacterium]|jgi:ABC-2 type transport system permease protein|nr:ABC transporter permease [Bacteroidales bacterium]